MTDSRFASEKPPVRKVSTGLGGKAIRMAAWSTESSSLAPQSEEVGFREMRWLGALQFCLRNLTHRLAVSN